MIIKKIAVGNEQCAFVESRLTDGFNIIFSDDNNKGKTIVIQSSLYALGNEPVFPSSFNFQDYYHYVEIELENEKQLSCSRKGSSFVVKHEETISIFDSVGDFKRFLNKNGITFPKIIKNNSLRMVDPSLLYQLFFVGQDGKNSSTIFNDGFYKKEDFWNMIDSLMGITPSLNIDFDSEEIKQRIAVLKEEKKALLAQNKLFKKKTPVAGLIFQNNDSLIFEEKIKKANALKNQIVELSKQRNRLLARKLKNEKTLKEIRSLNRSEKSGTLYCMDCNSKNIGYTSGDNSYTFDISNAAMRNNIIVSITDRIEAYQEEIDDCTLKINDLQQSLQEILSEDDVTLESLLMYKADITSVSEVDSRLVEIDNEISALNEKQKSKKHDAEIDEEKRQNIRNSIIACMNEYYHAMDPQGNLEFTDLFSKRSSVYSGCEETEFYLSKLFALKKVVNHTFPIMMDYFRDGELSTEKEKYVLDTFKEFNNQIIFTATLKTEELAKYDSFDFINQINYSDNQPSKLLTERDADEFRGLLQPLMIFNQ